MQSAAGPKHAADACLASGRKNVLVPQSLADHACRCVGIIHGHCRRKAGCRRRRRQLRPSTLNEVIVTATRRAEPVSKVGEGISVVTSDQLDTLSANSLRTSCISRRASACSPTARLATARSKSGASRRRASAATVAVYIDDIPFGGSSNLAERRRFHPGPRSGGHPAGRGAEGTSGHSLRGHLSRRGDQIHHQAAEPGACRGECVRGCELHGGRGNRAARCGARSRPRSSRTSSRCG